MAKEKKFQERLQQLDSLIHKMENIADPNTRTLAVEIVRSLMDFHGAGLDRIMEIVHKAGEAGQPIMDSFIRDDLIASLLLLYGLHPVDFDTRVRQALDGVRPYLRSHGGDFELLGIAN